MKRILVLLLALVGCSETESDSDITETEEVTIPEKQDYPNIDYFSETGTATGCLAYKTIFYKGVPVPSECEVQFIDTGRPPDKKLDLHIQEKVTETENQI